MKKYMLTLMLAMICVAASAQERVKMENHEQKIENIVDDYKIITDEVKDGVRYVTAAPSAKVCSKQIDIVIKDGIIQKVVYTRGCDGNAKGIGALIKDMTVEEALEFFKKSKAFIPWILSLT
mgnify:CR=1 FL=1